MHTNIIIILLLYQVPLAFEKGGTMSILYKPGTDNLLSGKYTEV